MSIEIEVGTHPPRTSLKKDVKTNGNPVAPMRTRLPDCPVGALGDRQCISVVIPAFNEGKAVVNLVKFLRSLTWGEGSISEILVDISGSNDYSCDELSVMSQSEPRLKVINTGIRDGLVPSLNRLISAATGDVVVRIDADVVLSQETIFRTVGALRNERIGIAGPRIVPITPAAGPIARVIRTLYILHDLISRKSPKITVVQAFRRVGIELPEISVMEDGAIQLEIESLGYRSVYVPDATVGICGPATLRDLLSQRIRTIRAIHWFTRSYGRKPPTAEPRLVLGALLAGIKCSQVTYADLFLFLTLEGVCRVIAALYVPFQVPPINWVPLKSTKPF